MISERTLSLWGLPSVEAAFEKATQYYMTDKLTQCRNIIIAMSKEQKKNYFFHALDLYPDNREFLQFIFGLI